jgi:hypothetical protein
VVARPDDQRAVERDRGAVANGVDGLVTRHPPHVDPVDRES